MQIHAELLSQTYCLLPSTLQQPLWHSHLVQGKERERLGAGGTKTGLKLTVGFIWLAMHYFWVTTVTLCMFAIAAVSFTHLVNQGAAQLVARGKIHVIIRVMGNAESRCLSSFYPPDATYPNGRITKFNLRPGIGRGRANLQCRRNSPSCGYIFFSIKNKKKKSLSYKKYRTALAIGLI